MQNGALPYKQMKNKDVIIEVQKGFRVEKASLPGCTAAESAESESALFRESGEDGVVLNPLRQETVRQIHVTQPLQAPNSNSNSAESRSTASVTATPDLVNGAVNLHAGRSTFEERGGYMRPRNLTPSTAVEGSSRQ
eukprot:gene18632-386_t